MSDTLIYNGGSTIPYNSDGNLDGERLLIQDAVLTGKKSEYTIIAARQLGFGGEAKVYLAIDNSTKQEFVAKIFTSLRVDDSKVIQNRNLIVDFLTQHSDYKKHNIMPLLDHGVLEIRRETGFISSYFVDILPYVEDGSLATSGRVNYATIKEKIIPSVNNALCVMHKNGIVHRDIKPSNLYMYDEHIVLSDFGTACAINIDDPLALVRTDTRRGSVGYMAPEVAGNYAVQASDYFSFGCTLGTLYNGEHFFKHLMERNDHIGMNRMFQLGQIPIFYRSGEEALKELIEGLLRIPINERMTYDAVFAWLNDYNKFKEKYVLNFSRKSAEWEFIFENTLCTNETELANAMAKKWQEAKDYLYSGGIKASSIITFFNSKNQTIAMRARRILEDIDTETEYDLGLARFLYYLTGGKAIHWEGHVFEKTSDIALYMNESDKVDKSILKLFTTKFLSWHVSMIMQKNPSESAKLHEVLAVISDIESLSESHPNLAYYYARLILLPPDKRVKKINFDNYFKEISASAYKFYESCGQIFFDDKELALFAYSSNKENILSFKEMISRLNFLSDINALYYFFEAVCEDKAKVRESYHKIGPNSYLYWFKNNLSYYNFSTQKARSLRGIIEKYQFSQDLDLKEQERLFLTLNQSLQDFFELFQQNIFLQSLGVIEQKEITAKTSGAFFIEDFYGKAVPPLFIYELFPKKEETDKR